MIRQRIELPITDKDTLCILTHGTTQLHISDLIYP